MHYIETERNIVMNLQVDGTPRREKGYRVSVFLEATRKENKYGGKCRCLFQSPLLPSREAAEKFAPPPEHIEGWLSGGFN